MGSRLSNCVDEREVRQGRAAALPGRAAPATNDGNDFDEMTVCITLLDPGSLVLVLCDRFCWRTGGQRCDRKCHHCEGSATLVML